MKNKMSIHSRIRFVNHFLYPYFSYIYQFYIIPDSIMDKIHEEARKLLIPYTTAYALDVLHSPMKDFA